MNILITDSRIFDGSSPTFIEGMLVRCCICKDAIK